MLNRWIVCTYVLLFCLAGQTAEQVLTVSGDRPIPAVLNIPERSQPIPAMLLLHGTASHKDEVGGLFQRLSQRLADEGIGSMRIDFAGAGDSIVDHIDYTLTSAGRDASAALRHLRAHAAIDAERVAVLGFSQGGLIAQRVTLAHPDIPMLVTWSTVAADGDAAMQAFRDRYYEEARENGFARVSFDWLPQPLSFNRVWFEEMAAQQTLSAMRDYTGPILAIAGLADKVVSFQQSASLVAQSPDPQSRVVLLAGADHIFNVLESEGGHRDSDSQLLTITTQYVAEGLARP